MSKQTQLLLDVTLLACVTAISWVAYGLTKETGLLIFASLLTLAVIVPLSRWVAVAALDSPSKLIRFMETLRAYVANESPSFENSSQPP